MNSISIIGNLTRDVELAETKNGTKVAKFDVAVSRKFDREKTDFFKIVAWKELAELCDKYLSKGKKVYINGRLEPREYEKDGVKKTIVEIVANEVEFLTPKSSGEHESTPSKGKPKLEPYTDDNDSPF